MIGQKKAGFSPRKEAEFLLNENKKTSRGALVEIRNKLRIIFSLSERDKNCGISVDIA